MISRERKKNKTNIDLSQLTLFDPEVLDSEYGTRQLIESGNDINAVNCVNHTPLMVAARYGKMEAVALLIHAGANLNHQDRSGCTALHIAFDAIQYVENIQSFNYKLNPYFSIISMLYAAHAEPLVNKRGYTPLMCLGYFIDITDFCNNEFSHYEAEYYECDKATYSLAIECHYAGDILGDYGSIFKIISNINVRRRFSTIDQGKELLIALKTNNIAKVRILFDTYPKIDVTNFVDRWGDGPLSIVIQANSHSNLPIKDCRPLLELLIYEGANDQQAALQYCRVGARLKLDLILFLIENGANTSFLDKIYNRLICNASFNNGCGDNKTAIEWLLHHCDDINCAEFLAARKHFSFTQVAEIFDKFVLDPDNAIDVALNNIISNNNINLILYCLHYEVWFYVRVIDSNQQVNFMHLLDALCANDLLSSFSKNRLAYLLKLQKQAVANAPSHVDPLEFYRFSRLMESLHEAMGDINKAIASAASGFKDTGALQCLSFWKRKQNPNPVIAAVAQQAFDMCSGLVVLPSSMKSPKRVSF